MRERERSSEDDVTAALALADTPVEDLTLRDLLLILFATVRARPGEDPQAWRMWHRYGADTHPSGRPAYTNTYVCERIKHESGVVIKPDYLGKLRNGDVVTPNANILVGLANFFHVDAVFLLPHLSRSARKIVDQTRRILLASLTRRFHLETMRARLEAAAARNVTAGRSDQHPDDELTIVSLLTELAADVLEQRRHRGPEPGGGES